MRSHVSPWVCHFHISKDIMKRKRLRVHSIIDALKMKYNFAKTRLKVYFPQLEITCKSCPVAVKQNEMVAPLCITVSVGSSRNSFTQLSVLRDMLIPFLLGTVIKGFAEFKKVDISWKDNPSSSKSSKGSPDGLYLRVFMSESCDSAKFWSVLVDSCLQISTMIDWESSHPDDIHDVTLAYGIDVAWMHFLSSLNSAISDTGKTIRPEHLVLTADCLAATGEFVALNAKGLAQQRKETSVASPMTLACFSNPGNSLIGASKMGILDNLQGTLDALSWGKTPPVGTGAKFDIIYSKKEHEPSKPMDVYDLLVSHNLEAFKPLPKRHQEISAKSLAQHLFRYDEEWTMPSKTILRSFISLNDILSLSQKLRQLLHRYDIGSQLNELDKAVVVSALYFHPRRLEKFGSGPAEIKVGRHPKYENARCFLVVRKDGTAEDFSYHKCVHHALQLIAPDKAQKYESKWLNGPKIAEPKVVTEPHSKA